MLLFKQFPVGSMWQYAIRGILLKSDQQLFCGNLLVCIEGKGIVISIADRLAAKIVKQLYQTFPILFLNFSILGIRFFFCCYHRLKIPNQPGSRHLGKHIVWAVIPNPALLPTRHFQ